MSSHSLSGESHASTTPCSDAIERWLAIYDFEPERFPLKPDVHGNEQSELTKFEGPIPDSLCNILANEKESVDAWLLLALATTLKQQAYSEKILIGAQIGLINREERYVAHPLHIAIEGQTVRELVSQLAQYPLAVESVVPESVDVNQLDIPHNKLAQVLFATSKETILTSSFSKLTSLFDVAFVVNEAFDSVTVHSNSMQFTGSRLKSIFQQWMINLECLTNSKDMLIQEVKLASFPEQVATSAGCDNRLHHFWQHYQNTAPVHQDVYAVIDSDKKLTYAEFERRTNILAADLLEMAKTDDACVGVLMEPSAETVISLAACFKVGITWVPLDSNYPVERLKYIVDNADINIVLSDEKNFKNLDLNTINWLLLDPAYFESDGSCPTTVEVQDLTKAAYIIYTSGSTGVPKGVKITHGQLAHYLRHCAGNYGLSNLQGGVVATSIGFDATVTSLMYPLSQHKTVRILPSKPQSLIKQLTETISGQQGNWLLKLTPSHLVMLRANIETPQTEARHTIVVGGENFDVDLWNWCLSSFPGCEWVNEYGPTEGTVGCTTYSSKSEHVANGCVPIGKPIAGITIAIVDEKGNYLPEGALGELCIAGDGVFDGYIGHKEIDKEYFLKGRGELSHLVFYKTGDLATRSESGNFIYAGRMDSQIKFRGYRIELEEIKQNLQNYEGIESSHVCFVKEPREELYAFFQSPKDLDQNAIEQHMATHLPDYMVPSKYVAVTQWPLTVNGKLDDKALLNLPLKEEHKASDEQLNENGLAIRKIWAEMLAKDEQEITKNSDFFALGGHSILVIRCIDAVRRELNLDVDIQVLFDHPVFIDFVSHCSRLLAPPFNDEIVPVSPKQAYSPLSSAQRRLWYLSHIEGNSSAYNMNIALDVDGQFDVQLAEKVFSMLIERHEVLRTVFVEKDGIPVQQVLGDFLFTIHRWQRSDDADCQMLINDLGSESFDLEQDLMLKVHWIQTSNDTSTLLVCMHHIATDGWSMPILIKEFVKIYQSLKAGISYSLPELEVQYSDYAVWQQNLLQSEAIEEQKGYWLRQLNGVPVLHNLPLARSRPRHKQYAGGQISQTVSVAEVEALKQYALKNNISLFMLLQGCLAQVISKFSGSHDVVIGSPTAGRTSNKLEHLVGFFINTIAYRLNTHSDNMLDYLSHVREVHIGAQNNQDIPLEFLVEKLNLPRTSAVTPLIQIDFSMDDFHQQNMEIEDVSFAVKPADSVSVRFDLDIAANINDDGLLLTWTYDHAIFDELQIRRFNDYYYRFLSALLKGAHALSELHGQASGTNLNEIMPLTSQNHSTITECLGTSFSVEAYGGFLIIDEAGLSLPKGAVGELLLIECGQLESGNEASFNSKLRAFVSDNGDLNIAGKIENERWYKGHRVDIEEVNEAIASLDSISQCRSEIKDDALVCVVEPKDADASASVISKQIKNKLLSVCNSFLSAESVILVSDSEVLDLSLRKALQQLNQQQWDERDDAPVENVDVYNTIAEIWSNLLNVPRATLAPNSHFFKLGGHSLLVIQCQHQLKEQLGITLTFDDLFENLTLSEQTTLVANTKSTHYILDIPRAPTDREYYPLSSAQRRLWTIDKFQGASPEYNMPEQFLVRGEFDVRAAEKAIAQLIQRHKVLRTNYREVDDTPRQFVKEDYDFGIEVVDLTHESDENKETKLRAVISESSIEPFDLSADLMIRAKWIKLTEKPEKTSALLFNMHHIATDGWSYRILLQEFGDIYNAFVNDTPLSLSQLPTQYIDYAEWEQSHIESSAFTNKLNYWQETLKDIEPLHGLPVSQSRTFNNNYNGGLITTKIAQSDSDNIKALAHEFGMSSFMVIHAIINLLLCRFSNRNEFVLGTPVSNRELEQISETVGFFANILPLRANVEFETLEAYLKHIRDVQKSALQNAEVPFDLIVKNADVPNGAEFHPVFQIMLVHDDSMLPGVEIEDIDFEPLPAANINARYDLTVHSKFIEGEWQVGWIYDSSLFAIETIEKLAAALQTLVSSLTRGECEKLANISLLDSTSQQEYANSIKALENTEESVALIPEQVINQALSVPDNIAVRSETDFITYEQLHKRSSQMARALIKDGVQSTDKVALLMDRDIEYVISVFAIMKTGAAFVPLDSYASASRITKLYEDGGIKSLVVDQSAMMKHPSLQNLPTLISYQTLQQKASNEADTDINLATNGNDLAYVIFTSGSTGESKGVMVEHASLKNSTLARFEVYSQINTLMTFAPIHVDASIANIFACLASGGTLFLPKQELISDSGYLEKVFSDYEISHITLVPSLYRTILQATKNCSSFNIEEVTLGGEEVSTELVGMHFGSKAFGNARLFNEYGPSEATIWSSVQSLHEGEVVNIGKPITNTNMYILDEYQLPLPDGVIGEIYIAGAGVARGYLNNDELSDSRFVTSRFHANTRLYRTGDYGRKNPNGTFEFVSRAEGQLKINGLRIEEEEIKLALCRVFGADDAKVVVPAGTNDMIALVSGISGIGNLSWRSEVAELLPLYMIPTAIIPLEKMPITISGKIDSNALTQMAAEYLAEMRESKVATFTAEQKWMSELWQGVLGDIEINPNSNFFALGGSSLTAIQLVNQVNRHLSSDFTVRELFLHPTLESFCNATDPDLSVIHEQRYQDLEDFEEIEF